MRYIGLVLVTSCLLLPDADSARARTLLGTLASAVQVADSQCALIAQQTNDMELATRCSAIYQAERSTLLAAATAVDEGRTMDAVCGALFVGAGLQAVADQLNARGVRTPDMVTDALIALEAAKPLCSGAR